MTAVVPHASAIRAPAQSQAAEKHSQGGTDQASSPFSELLQGCEAADPSATAPKPVEGKPAETAPKDTTAQKTGGSPTATPNVQTTAGVLPEPAPVAVAVTAGPIPVIAETISLPFAAGLPEEIVAAAVETIEAGDAEATPETAEAPAIAQPATPAPPVAQPASPAPPVAQPVTPQVTPQAAVAEPAVAPIPAATPAGSGAAASPVIAEPTSIATPVPPDVTAQVARPADGVVAIVAAKPTQAPKAAAAEQIPEQSAPVVEAKAETDSISGADTSAAIPAAKAEVPGKSTADLPAETRTNPPPRDSAPPDTRPAPTAAPMSPEAVANTNSFPAPAVTLATNNNYPAAAPATHQPLPLEAVPVHGLAVEIAANALNGKSRFEIRLDPPELGRIDVELRIDGDKVTSHLRVERPETLDLLRRDQPALERALQQSGLKTSDSGLQFSLRDQAFSQHNQGRDPQAMARIVVPDEQLAAVETLRPYGRLAGTGSGVDIRV